MAGDQTLLLTDADLSRIIEMAWEDRTPFEAILHQYGLDQAAVIRLMRANLNHSSFLSWRQRTRGQKTKHLALRLQQVSRHCATGQHKLYRR